jgi:hypothetical protein
MNFDYVRIKEVVLALYAIFTQIRHVCSSAPLSFLILSEPFTDDIFVNIQISLYDTAMPL